MQDRYAGDVVDFGKLAILLPTARCRARCAFGERRGEHAEHVARRKR